MASEEWDSELIEATPDETHRRISEASAKYAMQPPGDAVQRAIGNVAHIVHARTGRLIDVKQYNLIVAKLDGKYAEFLAAAARRIQQRFSAQELLNAFGRCGCVIQEHPEIVTAYAQVGEFVYGLSQEYMQEMCAATEDLIDEVVEHFGEVKGEGSA